MRVDPLFAGARIVPGLNGFKLAIRPTAFGEGVQLAILGKRGGCQEAIPIGLQEIPGTIFAIDDVSEEAWELSEERHRRRWTTRPGIPGLTV